MSYDSLMVFTGNANPKLAEAVARHLHLHLGRAKVGRFSDGEVMVEILENVRGRDVFVLQSTCAPTNDNLMEVLVMVDALKRASAGRITAAMPYFGYARQDRRLRSARVAITAKLVADMLSSAGVDRLLTMDLHSDQIQGFFDIPVDNIYAKMCIRDRSLPDLLDGRTATAARFAAAPVHPIVLLEVAGLARGVHKVAQAAAAQVDGFGQGRADFRDQFCATRQAEFSGSELRFDPGAEQRFVGVDVAHADHDVVVHDALFDTDVAPARGLMEIARIEVVCWRPIFQWFRAECREQRVGSRITCMP